MTLSLKEAIARVSPNERAIKFQFVKKKIKQKWKNISKASVNITSLGFRVTLLTRWRQSSSSPAIKICAGRWTSRTDREKEEEEEEKEEEEEEEKDTALTDSVCKVCSPGCEPEMEMNMQHAGRQSIDQHSAKRDRLCDRSNMSPLFQMDVTNCYPISFKKKIPKLTIQDRQRTAYGPNVFFFFFLGI